MKAKIISVLSSLGAVLLSCFGGACGPACFLSGCCGSYAILGFIGISGASLSFLNKLTPVFLALTVLSLGYAFYQAYKPKPKACCETGNSPESKDCCTNEKKPSFLKSKAFLWIITIMCVILWTYPLISGNNKSVDNINCCPGTDTVKSSCCPRPADSTATFEPVSIKTNTCCPGTKN
ncbi:MAG TPA: hypothetical protein PKW80_02825 [Bacteroidales bacterium]|nr:hypothetical protein [Bacteroidales bacterium]